MRTEGQNNLAHLWASSEFNGINEENIDTETNFNNCSTPRRDNISTGKDDTWVRVGRFLARVWSRVWHVNAYNFPIPDQRTLIMTEKKQTPIKNH